MSAPMTKEARPPATVCNVGEGEGEVRRMTESQPICPGRLDEAKETAATRSAVGRQRPTPMAKTMTART